MQVSYAGIICNRANIHIHHRIDFILPATRKPTCLVIPCKYSSSKSKSCMKIIYLTCDPVREWIPLLMAFLILCIHIQLINLRYISCHGRFPSDSLSFGHASCFMQFQIWLTYFNFLWAELTYRGNSGINCTDHPYTSSSNDLFSIAIINVPIQKYYMPFISNDFRNRPYVSKYV